MWLAAGMAAVALILLAVWLAIIALPLAISDRVAIGVAIGTVLDGLLAAWLTVHPGGWPIGRPAGHGNALQGAQNAAGEPAPAGVKVDAGARTPTAPPAAQPPTATQAAAHSGRLQLAELGHLTDLLVAIREIRSPSQWQLLLDTLPAAVTQSVPRQASGRLEIISLLRTCEDYPGAWPGLESAIGLLAPQSAATAAFLAELHRLGLVGEQTGPA
jgi:Effector-associated domain 2